MNYYSLKIRSRILLFLWAIFLTPLASFAQTETGNYPCSTFEPGSGVSWLPHNVDVAIHDNALDGSKYMSVMDGGAYSAIINTQNYKELGKRFIGKCLCFDYQLEHATLDSFHFPYHPKVTIRKGTKSIQFFANAAVMPGSPWISICLPIEHCSGVVLPGNSDGHWEYGDSVYDCNGFNDVLDNATSLEFPVDINNNITEVMNFDNICVKNCPKDPNEPCKFDIQDISAQLPNTISIISSAYNPNLYYTVDWGDGAIVASGPYQTANFTHTYSQGGCYRVCITAEDDNRQTICTYCQFFCFNTNGDGNEYPDAQQRPGSAQWTEHKFTISPNPFSNDIRVNFLSEENGIASIQLLDMTGRVIRKIEQNIQKGSQIITIPNAQELAKGIYWIDLRINNKLMGAQKLSK